MDGSFVFFFMVSPDFHFFDMLSSQLLEIRKPKTGYAAKAEQIPAPGLNAY